MARKTDQVHGPLDDRLCAHRSTDGQGWWARRVDRLVRLTGHLEPFDALYRVIEQDVGACTRAYLAKDRAAWCWYALRIHHHLQRAPKGSLECHPTWS